MFRAAWRAMGWPLRFLFGRDVFLSYARADGDAYVSKLADHLRRAKPRISYFLDLHVATADPVIPRAAIGHARRCRVFVLLASGTAMNPERGTMRELEAFVERPRRLFVPISVDGAYEKRDREALPWKLVSGSTAERETADSVEEGVVSPAVLDRIESIVGNWRFQRRLNTASSFALLLVALGGVFFFRSIVAAGDARANRLAVAASSPTTHDYSLSLLLAAEGLTLRPDLPFTRSAMFDVIGRHGGLVTLLHPKTPPSTQPLSSDVSAVGVSPDGSKLASGQATGFVRIWDTRRHVEMRPPLMMRGRVWHVEFDRSGTQLLASTTIGEITVLDLQSGRRKQAQLPAAAVTRFRPEGGVAAVEDRALVDPFTNETLLSVGAEVLSFAFNSDGARVVTGGNDGFLHLFDWKTRRPLSAKKIYDHGISPPEVWSVVASPRDPTVFAATDQDGTLFVFGPGAGQAIRPGVGDAQLAFSPDGSLLAATIGDGLQVMRMPALALEGKFTYADQPLMPAFVDGHTLASGNRDATIALFSLHALDRYGAARTLEKRVFAGKLGLMKRASFTTAGDRIAVSDERKQTRVIDLRRPAASGAALLPYVRRRGYVELEDAIGGRVVRSIPLPSRTATTFDAAISGDGLRVAALIDETIDKTDDRSLLVYDAATAKLLQKLPLHDALVSTIALDRQGKRFAVGDIPGNVVVRSVADGEELAHFFQGDAITAVAFSPDGRALVASDSGSTNLYTLESALLLGSRALRADCLQFSPDGETMAVCENEGLHVWQMSSAAWCAAARHIAGRTLTAIERSEYAGRR